MTKLAEAGKNGSVMLRIAVISMILCGLVFPLVVTGFAQVLFPSQAGGSLVNYNGKHVGSDLVAQDFSLAPYYHYFFQSRNDSASGVDPDVSLDNALAQVSGIANWTRIDPAAITGIVNKNVERTMWWFGDPYCNVLRLNLDLLQTYPTVYHDLNSTLFK